MKKIIRRFRNKNTWVGVQEKLTLKNIEELMNKTKSNSKALNIYCDIPWPSATESLPDFKKTGDVQNYVEFLKDLPANHYETLIAVGLLEHLPNPQEFINECHRILITGGILVLRVSSTFSVHVGPHDYFHFTIFGMRLLLNEKFWKEEILEGSSQPYRTIAILLQRVLFQTRSKFMVRLLTHMLILALPKFDAFVQNQYFDTSYSQESKIDSMLPSNINGIFSKK